jgi:hypothetical protein
VPIRTTEIEGILRVILPRLYQSGRRGTLALQHEAAAERLLPCTAQAAFATAGIVRTLRCVLAGGDIMLATTGQKLSATDTDARYHLCRRQQFMSFISGVSVASSHCNAGNGVGRTSIHQVRRY